MELRYRTTSHQKARFLLWPVARLVTVFVVGSICSVIWFDIESKTFLSVLGFTWIWFFCMHLLPIAVMGIRHSAWSKNAMLSLDTDTNEWRYDYLNHTICFYTDQIEKVIKVVSPPTYDNRSDLLGFGYFYYWKVLLKNGNLFSISCLVVDVDIFPPPLVSLEKRMFPMPSHNKWTISLDCSDTPIEMRFLDANKKVKCAKEK